MMQDFGSLTSESSEKFYFSAGITLSLGEQSFLNQNRFQMPPG
jgi:hypothetical protein